MKNAIFALIHTLKVWIGAKIIINQGMADD